MLKDLSSKWAKICAKPAAYRQFLYRFCRKLVQLWYRLLYGYRVVGLEYIPAEGGALVASNHVSLLDPPLVGISITGRQVHFVAKKELFKIPLLGPILAGCGCIWVDRHSKDGRSVNQAIQLLRGGRLVGIFPEGTRSKSGQLQKARLGVAMMALKAGTPIVPACLFNTYETGRRYGVPNGKPLGIRFGPPLEVEAMEKPTPEAMKRLCERVMEAIAQLQAQGPP